MMKTKRILCLLLTFILLITYVPSPITAEEAGDGGSTSDSALISLEEETESFYQDDADISDVDTSDDDGIVDGEVEGSSYNSEEVLGGTEISCESGIVQLDGTGASDAIVDPSASADHAELNATPYLSLSATSVSIRQGSAQRVVATVGGYNRNVILNAVYPSSGVLSVSWSYAGESSRALTIVGNRVGSGTIVIQMLDAETKNVIRSANIAVTVTGTAKISLSLTNFSLQAGKQQKITATFSNYEGMYYASFGITNSKVVSAHWDSAWSGSSIGLYVDGLIAGSTTIRIDMRNAYTDEVVATKTITVSVYGTPTITPSVSSVTIKTGASTDIFFTVSGIGGQQTVAFNNNNRTVCEAKWIKFSNGVAQLRVTGKNTGSAKIAVDLWNAEKKTLARVIISVKVESAGKPTLTANITSVTSYVGSSSIITFHVSNLTEPCYLVCNWSDGEFCDVKWGSSSGGYISLTVQYKKIGSDTLRISLKKSANDKTLDTVKIKVSAQATAAFKQYGYNFENFGKAASKTLCKFMYGNNETANAVYKAKAGAGGNCFGMVTSAALFFVPGNGVNVTDYRSKAVQVYDLKQGDKGSEGISVKEFVMCMQISWYATTRKVVSEKNLKQLIDNIAYQCQTLNQPVCIEIRGLYDGGNKGHALLAYGYDRLDSDTYRIYVIDSNYVGQTRYIYLDTDKNGNFKSWEYQLFDDTTWGTGRTHAEIGYLNYSAYKSIWDNRGKLATADRNLFVTNAGDFSLVDVYGNVVAEVVDGILVNDNTEIDQIKNLGVCPDASYDETYYSFYLPSDLYTLKCNDSDIEELRVILAGDMLSADVTTTADEITFCADDASDICSAMVSSEGEETYQIALTSNKNGETETINYDGSFTDTQISVLLDGGNLSTCNTESASVTVDRTENEELFCTITASADDGGTISPSGETLALIGSDAVFEITPDEDHVVQDVYFDGVSVGAVNSYVFTEVSEDHTIHATFKKVDHEEVCPGKLFSDMPDTDNWAHAPIDWAIRNNITNGTSATTFSPNDPCMRGHVVTFLWRAVGCPEPIGTDNPFVDVKPGDFYYKPVLWALENGITSGMDATHFGPTSYCNRAQVVTFLYRTMGSPALENLHNPFADVQAGAFYEKPVLWAVEKGITNGLSATEFGPNAICNRAQIVTFLYRAFVND